MCVARANKSGFTVNPMGAAQTAVFLKHDDTVTYQIFSELGLVKNPK